QPALAPNFTPRLPAHGETEPSPAADLAANQIPGAAMRVLNDFAMLTPSLYEDDDPTRPHILDPSLLAEFERVKITLQPTSLEDFANLWTALPQANFRRSVTYEVSVVQIESQRPRRFPRLVGEPPPA